MKLKLACLALLVLWLSINHTYSQNISNSSPYHENQQNYNPEIDSNNLMLIDATLELNEAMLAGVKASLDTLQKPEPELKNSSDIKEILKRMKRAKDRTQLVPYLQRVNDSLTLDNRRLQVQKTDILSRLNPYLEYLKIQDSLQQAATHAPTAAITSKNKSKQELPAAKNTERILAQKKSEPVERKKREEKKPENAAVVSDTMIVFDIDKPEAKATTKATKDKKQEEPSKLKKKTNKETQQNANRFDTIVIIDAPLDLTPAPTVVSSEKANNKLRAEEKNRVKDTEPKTELTPKRQTTSTGDTEIKPVTSPVISNADTIRKIKSQFFLARAQKALMEKKDKQAQEYLQKSIELWHNNYDAWLTLAKQDGLNGSFTKALSEYNECALIDSTQPKLYYDMGMLYLQNKKKTEALNYFTKTIQIDPEYTLAYMERATIYKDWKQYANAINDYNTVLAKNVNYHFAYKARGIVMQLNRKFTDAIDDFTRYLLFEETDPSAYYYRGLSKIGNNELLDGCMDLSKASEMGYSAAERAIKLSCE